MSVFKIRKQILFIKIANFIKASATWCHYLRPSGWWDYGTQRIPGLVYHNRSGRVRRQPCCLPFVFFFFFLIFHFLDGVLTPCWARAESDILFGSWQHHLERKMKRDGDNTETRAFAHTSRRPVHPTLFTGQFGPRNLGAKLKWREKTKMVR